MSRSGSLATVDVPVPEEAAVAAAAKDKVFEEEWEHEAVPHRARKGLASVSLVWLGFPMIITGAVTGALIVAGLGFKMGMAAIALGNLALLAYVGALSALGARSGFNFALLARTTLGSRGYLLASGLLSTVVVGWFAVQTGLVADSLDGAFGWNGLALSVIAGLLFTGVTLFGIRALTWLGAVSAPLFVGFGIYAVVLALQESSVGAIVGYAGDASNLDAAGLTLGAAVTIVVSLFIDSGTMTPDFTRWARSPRHAWLATATAFPFANALAMVFGGIVTAAAAGNANFFELVAGEGGLVAGLAVVFLFLNLGTVCTHCLYNAAVGWAHILGARFAPVALAWGLVGTVIAAAGVWSQFTNWLILLGVIVPPIGAVLLTDHLVLRRGQRAAEAFSLTGLPAYQAAPVVAWAVGAGAALGSHFAAPQLAEVLVGSLAAAGCYVLLVRLAPRLSGGTALGARVATAREGEGS
jgi:cytosine permease